MSRTSLEAGFTLLEVMLVLVVLASLSTLAVLSTRTPAADARPVDLARFIAERRSAAILSGRPVSVFVTAGSVRSGQLSHNWSGELRIGLQAIQLPYTLTAYTDGSYSGPPLAVVSIDEEHLIAGTYREPH